MPLARQHLPYSLTLPAFGDANGDALTHGVVNLPPGLSFNAATRTISGTPTVDGGWVVAYSGSDGQALTTMYFTLTVEANAAPVAPVLSAQTGGVGGPVLVVLPAFTDANSDPLSYSVSNLPPGLSFNPATRTISGTPTTAGSWTVSYQANDGRGGVTVASVVYTISATPPPNREPVVSNALQNQTAEPNAGFYYPLPVNSFTDPEGQTLSYRATISPSSPLTTWPSWLVFNPDTRAFSGIPTGTLERTWIIRVTATDTGGLSTFDEFELYKPESGGGGGEPDSVGGETQGTVFEMGADSSTDALSTQSTASASAVGVQTRDQWFSYDAQNRLQVVNGVLSGAAGAAGTTIVLTVQTPLVTAADNYEQRYDAVGRVSATYRQRDGGSSGVYTEVNRTLYDQRGNRQYELHAQRLGDPTAPADPGIRKHYQYDAANRLIETRSYFEEGSYTPTNYEIQYETQYRDISGWLSQAEVMRYDADDRLRWQASYQRDLGAVGYFLSAAQEQAQRTDVSTLVLDHRVDYTEANNGQQAWNDSNPDDNASQYDAAGRLKGYRYTDRQNTWYTHTFTSTYEGWESWQEKTVAGISTDSTYKATTNTLTLDAYGRVTQQREHTVGATLNDRVRVYSYNGDGAVQTRREGTVNGSNVFTQSTGGANNTPQNFQFVHAAGQQLAELQAGGEVRTALPGGGGRFSQTFAQLAYAANGGGRQTNTLSGIVGNSGPYTAGGGTVAVQQGETLQSLAQRIYGSSTLWYVLADANGYSDPSAELTAGVQLKTPSVGVNSNDAGTFKPYNPNEAIGSTSPTLPFIPPPPKQGCNTLALILIVVIAVVVTVFTAGAAATAIAPGVAAASGAGTAAIGASVLAGTATGIGFGASVAVGAIAGAAGVAVSSAAASLAGVGSFSWRGVAAGAITGGITAGFGAAANAGVFGAAIQQAGSTARIAAGAVAGNLGSYAANKLVGNDASFSWRSVAASAISAVVTAKIAPALTSRIGNDTVQDFAGGALGSVVSYGTRKAFGFDEQFNSTAVINDGISAAINGVAGRSSNPARRGSNLKSDVAGKSDLSLSKSFSTRYPYAMAAQFGHRSGNGAVYDDGTSPNTTRIGNVASRDELDALDAEGRAIERDVLAATTPEELAATRRRLDAWHLKNDAALGLSHTRPATQDAGDDGYTYAHDSNIPELERIEVTAGPRSNPITAAQWAGVMQSIGFDKPFQSRSDASPIVFSEPPPSTRGQVYAQQLAGGRRTFDNDPATAPRYAMQRVANDLGVLTQNSFAGGAYGIARAAGATHAQSMQAAQVAGDTTNAVIAGASIYGAVKMRSQSPTTLVEINGGTRTIYSGQAAQASEPYRISSGGYSVGAVRYTSETGGSAGVYSVGGWRATARIGNNRLNFQPSSGVALEATPGRTTTILGNYGQDIRHVINELGNVKSTDFGPRTGGFNVLNVPDSLNDAKRFWGAYNRPWLSNAVTRGDPILMATEPKFGAESKLIRFNEATRKFELSGFGKEYLYLRQNGFRYDPAIKQMVRSP